MSTVVARRDTFTVEQLRQFQGPPAPAPVDVDGVTFGPQRLADREMEIAVPASDLADADLLFFHGGGYIAGVPSTQRRLIGSLAREARVRIWTPDYRLAPEHPHPAALDDAVATYGALVEKVDTNRLVLAGESAGGGLAAATLIAARDAGLPLPAAVVLLCPWTDLTLTGKSFKANAGKDLLTPAFTEMCRDAYVGDQDPRDPSISPLFADLSGLPPTFIQVGDLDLIRDDSVRYAQAATDAGSPAELRIWAKVGHGFTGTGDDLPESRAAIAEIAEWIRTQLLGS